jgi:histidine phosphatase superfamily protein (branch 1)
MRMRCNTYGITTFPSSVSCSSSNRSGLMDTRSLVLLVRHARTHAIDARLVGRTPGVHLSERGYAELARLREQLATISIDAVYSSPLVRARETAEPIATDHCLGVDIEDDLNEVDFGDWTGATFDVLQADPRWDAFARRSAAVCQTVNGHLTCNGELSRSSTVWPTAIDRARLPSSRMPR